MSSLPTHFEGRSEGAQGELSSHIARPRWRRMLRAAALLLSKTLKASGQDEDVWIYPDAIGGGIQTDFSSLLSSLLEACGLGEEESGTVLIGMYTFLQANDLPMTAQTWRVLTVTAMLAAVKGLISDRTTAAGAEARLREAVVHWWPKANADKALRVFTDRPNFGQYLLTPSVFAECYYTLRESGLKMGYDDESAASAVRSASQAPTRSYVAVSRQVSGSVGSTLGSSMFLLSDGSSAIDEEVGQDPRPHVVQKSSNTILFCVISGSELPVQHSTISGS